MGKKSRDKGNSFERAVAAAVRAAWGLDVSRTPLSGGWGKRKTGGDLVFMDDNVNLFVECKNPRSVNLETILLGEDCPIFSWWDKALGQAASERKTNTVLVFKWWRSRTWVLTRSSSCGVTFHRNDEKLLLLPLEDWLACGKESYVKV